MIPAGGQTETCTKVPKKYPEHMQDKVVTYDQEIQNSFDTCSSTGGTQPAHLTHLSEQTIRLKLGRCVEAG